MVGSVYLAGRLLDRRWFREFGFRFDRDWWTDLGFGLGLGAVLMTGVFVVERRAVERRLLGDDHRRRVPHRDEEEHDDEHPSGGVL